MQVNNMNQILIGLDRYSEYVPIVSYVTLLVNAIQNQTVIAKMDPAQLARNTYYSHIKSKSTSRKVILLIPIVGNIIVALWDGLFQSRYDKNYQLEQLKQNPTNLQFAGRRIKGDLDFVKQAVLHDSSAIHSVSDELKNDAEIVKLAIANVLKFAQENPFKKWEIRGMSEKIARNLNDENRADPIIMNILVQLNGELIRFSSPELKANDLHIKIAAHENLYSLRYVNLEKAVPIAIQKIKSNPQSFFDLPAELMRHPRVWETHQLYSRGCLQSSIG